MPVSDPRAGRAFIWLISWFLFLTIAAGGGCLVMYMILPETTATAWLPIAGVSLVCLPWLFWLLTFMYRIFSRIFGFRIGCGGGGGGGDDENVAEIAAANDESPAENGGRKVQFEAAVTVHENEGGGGGGEREEERKHSTASATSSNSSVMSHESEMPLASSMAS